PQYLRALISNPSAEKPSTTMPDVLHDLTGSQKAEAVDALVHFLSSQNTTNALAATSASEVQISQGRLLYHQVGCVACHAPQESAAALFSKASSGPEESALHPEAKAFEQDSFEHASVPLRQLAKKLTVDELTRFLINPLQTRPSGRMPSLNLTEAEAAATAMYLLREQSAATNHAGPAARIKGLAYEYFEGNFTETAQLDGARPKDSGVVEWFSVKPRKRVEYIGFRFSGLLTIASDGDYTFFVASDDGSRLFIDDLLVVDNDGHHST